MLLDQFGQPGLFKDGDSVGIEPAGQRGRIFPALDIGNLGGRERHDFVVGVVAIVGVEVVEIASRRTHDNHFLFGHVLASTRIICSPLTPLLGTAGGPVCAPRRATLCMLGRAKDDGLEVAAKKVLDSTEALAHRFSRGFPAGRRRCAYSSCRGVLEVVKTRARRPPSSGSTPPGPNT